MIRYLAAFKNLLSTDASETISSIRYIINETFKLIEFIFNVLRWLFLIVAIMVVHEAKPSKFLLMLALILVLLVSIYIAGKTVAIIFKDSLILSTKFSELLAVSFGVIFSLFTLVGIYLLVIARTIEYLVPKGISPL